MTSCSVDGCEKPRRANTFCVAHNRRFKVYGDPLGAANPDGPSRLWRWVQRGGADECWPFTGSHLPKGYGLLRFEGNRLLAHRLSFYLHNGFWPVEVCHSCDNPPCVNPGHLFAGDRQTNTDDMVQKGRQSRGERKSQASKAAWARAKAEDGTPDHRGMRNGRAVVSDADVVEIRRLAAEGVSQTAIAERFGIKQPQVSRIVRREQRA